MGKHPQERIMLVAIEEAKRSAAVGQYALGAVVVGIDGEIISVAHTTTHAMNDATAHAEVNAIRMACGKMKSRYLYDCWLYTTLEPCPMCTSAVIWAKMGGVVFGASREDAIDFGKNLKNEKFTWRQIDIPARYIVERGNPKVNIIEGFMREECKTLFNLADNR